MKRITLLLITTILSTSAYSQDKLEKVSFENKTAKTREVFFVTNRNIKSGKYTFTYKKHPQIKGNYSNNRKIGLWEYSPDKNFRIVGKYEDDLKVGKWVYLKNLDTISILNYEKGVRVGKQLGFFDNKKIAYEATCNSEGKLEGEEKVYFENGKLATIIHNRNGELHGDRMAYTEKGDLIYKLTYANNTPVNLTIVTKNVSESEYTGNLANGNGKLVLTSKRDRKILLERNFRDSLLHGEIISYNYEGKVRYKGNYENGYMVGVWQFFNQNEELIKEKEYFLHQELKYDNKEYVNQNHENAFAIIGEMPIMDINDNNFRKFISENLKYPSVAASKGSEGRVFISFVINEVGQVENAKVDRGVEPSLDAEALRVVNSSPLWRPGLKSRIPVRVSFNFPIIFVLQ
jgi:TonB family protein